MKYAVSAVAAALALGSLSACGDSRPCLSGHNDMILMPIRVGKTVTMIPEQVFVCDKYAKAAS